MYEIYLDVSQLKLTDHSDTITLQIPSVAYPPLIARHGQQYTTYHGNANHKNVHNGHRVSESATTTQISAENSGKGALDMNSMSGGGEGINNGNKSSSSNDYILKLHHSSSKQDVSESELQKLILQHIDNLQKQYDRMIKSKIAAPIQEQQQIQVLQKQEPIRKEDQKEKTGEKQKQIKQKQSNGSSNYTNNQTDNNMNKNNNPFTNISHNNSLFSNTNTNNNNSQPNQIFTNQANNNPSNSTTIKPTNNNTFFSYNTNTNNFTSPYQNQMNMFTKNAMKNSNTSQNSIFSVNSSSLLNNPQSNGQKWSVYQNNPTALFSQSSHSQAEGTSSLFGGMQNDGGSYRTNTNKNKNGRKGLTFA